MPQRTSSLASATGDGEHSVGSDDDGPFFEQTTDSAFEGLLADSEHRVDVLRARLVADARWIGTAQRFEDGLRVVGELLVRVCSQRELDLSVPEDVGDPKPCRLATRQR